MDLSTGTLRWQSVAMPTPSAGTGGEERMGRAIKLGLIGAGFIGRSHALAIHAVNRVFPAAPLQAVPFILAEEDEERARAAARRLGFEHATASWQEAVDRSDALIVAVPSLLHAPILRRAIAAGKP